MCLYNINIMSSCKSDNHIYVNDDDSCIDILKKSGLILEDTSRLASLKKQEIIANCKVITPRPSLKIGKNNFYFNSIQKCENMLNVYQNKQIVEQFIALFGRTFK